MAEIAERMTRDSLDAFVRKDAALARDVLARDDEVDELKDHVFRVLLTYMMADPGTIERALSLILVSRNMERIADHATNIAEDVIFLVEAKDVRHHHEERGVPVRARGAGGPGAAARGRAPPRASSSRTSRDIAEAIGYQLEKAGLQVRVARTGRGGPGCRARRAPTSSSST